MKIMVACLFGVLVLTGIAGHLFSRREVTTTSPPPPKPHHEALAKLIRTSEDAIGWIGNKTLDSINNFKNLTASAVTPESPLVVKKNKFFNWLRGMVHYNNSSSSVAVESTEAPEDSGESVVIAHRTPDHGFSWGAPKNNSDGNDVTSSSGVLNAAGRRVHNVLSYLYQTSRNITRRGKDILQSGIEKVKTTKELLKSKLLKKNYKHEEESAGESTTIAAAPTPADVYLGVPCDDEVDNVCAVDWERNIFSIFRNGCWVRVYNQRHGTNFSIHDSDVCITLFAQNPENYQKIENPQL